MVLDWRSKDWTGMDQLSLTGLGWSRKEWTVLDLLRWTGLYWTARPKISFSNRADEHGNVFTTSSTLLTNIVG